MADIEMERVTLPNYRRGLDDITASFTAMTNAPARLQVWLHDEKDPRRIEVVDVRMFLNTLELKRDAIPMPINPNFTQYIPGSKTVDAHLVDRPGWTWRFEVVMGRRVAVPVPTR